MSEKQPKLKFEEDKERTATRSPPKKSKVEQSKPQKQKLKLDADKAAEKAQHLRFGKAEITPDEASRMTKQQKRAMYACPKRKIFRAEADCGTRCRRIRHRRGRLQLALPMAAETGYSEKLPCRSPVGHGGAARRR